MSDTVENTLKYPYLNGVSRQLYTVYTQTLWVSKQGNCTALITTVEVTGELTVDCYEGIQNFEFSITKNGENMTRNSDRDS